ncbi:MAG: ATP-binding cassette domain-containing protein [Ignavibacteria bacterium]|nr:ATP-binding cassette domain-containing protein [Ignavibacteria bacterium]MBK7577680.1 ATP-binding cassette domain-containing protein [Ignavibacteria bacterium]
MSQPLLEVKNLRVRFPVTGGVLQRKVAEVKAVDGVSFAIERGETLGLVGESGCGKTTVGRALINILKHVSPGVELDGEVIYVDKNGTRTDLLQLSKRDMIAFRSKIQMIFQDPYSSLNARLSVKQIISEPLEIHMPEMSKQQVDEKVMWLLERVGLQPEYAGRYPHEFSGGQRQRIGIARALATNPDLIICDEPVSALDVSVQAQVINLMEDLQKEFGMSYLFIAHDLSVVYHISKRIAVMYLGNVAEIGTANQVYFDPVHPYSKALISAIPEPDPTRKNKERVVLQGDIPTPLNKPSGCGFRTRCPIARPECAVNVPELLTKGNGAQVACPYV